MGTPCAVDRAAQGPHPRRPRARREGLVALNTLLIAGDLHAEIIERRSASATTPRTGLIWNFAMATGAAVALNPIPVVDIAGGLAVDVGMIVALPRSTASR